MFHEESSGRLAFVRCSHHVGLAEDASRLRRLSNEHQLMCVLAAVHLDGGFPDPDSTRLFADPDMIARKLNSLQSLVGFG